VGVNPALRSAGDVVAPTSEDVDWFEECSRLMGAMYTAQGAAGRAAEAWLNLHDDPRPKNEGVLRLEAERLQKLRAAVREARKAQDRYVAHGTKKRA
jgi:hypothetical protein